MLGLMTRVQGSELSSIRLVKFRMERLPTAPSKAQTTWTDSMLLESQRVFLKKSGILTRSVGLNFNDNKQKRHLIKESLDFYETSCSTIEGWQCRFCNLDDP